MAIGTFLGLVIDCDDPVELSRFWQQMLGGNRDSTLYLSEWCALSQVPKIGYLGFQKVPEQKTVKNRVHIDIDVEAIDSAVNLAISIGATKIGEIVEEQTNWFQVMADPEGNEFCFILRRNR
ncbi:MAG: VOC family protein [Actinomycetes bacterium]